KRGASRSKLLALSSQPWSASTGTPSPPPHSRAARVRPGSWKRRSSGIRSETRTSPTLLLLLKRSGGREPLGDEALELFLLLIEARARQEQHAVARLETGDDLAVLEVGDPGLDLHGNRSVVAQRDDPVLAAEHVRGRVGGLRDARSP